MKRADCPSCVEQRRTPNRLDHCPVCGRHIFDMDMSGVEGEDAQRWCVAHLPDSHPQAALRAELPVTPATTVEVVRVSDDPDWRKSHAFRAACECGWHGANFNEAQRERAVSEANAHPHRCDSGLVAPATLRDEGYWYAIAGCGYVVRIPATERHLQSSAPLSALIDAHTAKHHPARYRQQCIHEAMSRG
jgi:hypothetical protein